MESFRIDILAGELSLSKIRGLMLRINILFENLKNLISQITKYLLLAVMKVLGTLVSVEKVVVGVVVEVWVVHSAQQMD